MIPVGAIVNGAKTVLDAAKTANDSSAESSIQKGNYKEDPMEIKRTEGDLGYDSEKQEADEKPQNADYMDQFKDTEMADISEANPEVNNVETTEAKGISGKLDNLFNLVGTASMSEGENKAVSNDAEGRLDLDNTPGGSTDSAYQGVHLGSAETAPVMSSGSNIPNAPLNIPVEETQQEEKPTEKPTEEEKSPLEQAKEAVADNGDIDDKELPFTDTEQAAEDVEDLVQDETKSDEEKEEILEKGLENDSEIDEGELEDKSAEEAGNTEAAPGEEPTEEEDPKAKAKELLDKFLGYAKHDSSSSADSSISGGSAPAEDAMNIQSGSLGDAVAELLGGSAGNASYSPDSVSSNALQAPDPSVNNLSSAISQKGASGSVKDISNEVSNASSSSGSGPIAKAFNDIVNGKGLDYTSSSGESKFSDALGKGSVGSVGSSNRQSAIGSGKNIEASFKSNPVAVIKAQVKENFNDWKERDGVSYKAKGSVLVTTENGKDIQVKLGSRRAVPLEKVPEDKLPYVEAVVK